MTRAQMCDTDLRRCYCCAGFLEHRLVWTLSGCDIAMVLRGVWVTTITHAQMCDTDLRRCYCGAGFLEHHLVWSPVTLTSVTSLPEISDIDP